MTAHDTQVALVTGANKGIGLAIARQLGERGIRVYLGARDPGRGQAAQETLRAAGVDAHYVHLDVTDEATAARAATRIGGEAGRLDILVNNAGISVRPHRLPSETPVDEVRRTFETNVFGVIAVTNAMLPLLRRSRAGRIVNITSDLGSLTHAVAGDHPMGRFPTLLGYNASKTALNAVTVTYANELRTAGIRVNAVSPPYVATDLNDFEGYFTPEQGARLPVRVATLDGDGPTAAFLSDDGTPEGRVVPW